MIDSLVVLNLQPHPKPCPVIRARRAGRAAKHTGKGVVALFSRHIAGGVAARLVCSPTSLSNLGRRECHVAPFLSEVAA